MMILENTFNLTTPINNRITESTPPIKEKSCKKIQNHLLRKLTYKPNNPVPNQKTANIQLNHLGTLTSNITPVTIANIPNSNAIFGGCLIETIN
jgi:hypothetical protein